MLSRARHDLHGLAGAYVLDALPPDEERAFEQHLTTCEVCRLEADELRETVARLGLAVSAEPPAQLRSRVLGRAQALRQHGPRPQHDAPAPASRRVVRALAPLAAAAAASAVTLVLADIGRQPGLDPAVAAVLAAPDARIVALDAPGGPQANLHHSPSRGRVVLFAEGLERLGRDEVYQVWTYRDGRPEPSGLLDLDEHGVAGIALPREDGESVAVTVEPAGGSAEPSGRLVAQGRVTD